MSEELFNRFTLIGWFSYLRRGIQQGCTNGYTFAQFLEQCPKYEEKS